VTYHVVTGVTGVTVVTVVTVLRFGGGQKCLRMVRVEHQSFPLPSFRVGIILLVGSMSYYIMGWMDDFVDCGKEGKN
jgi:hypothetical protein